jgi:prepilin-type N-terminal cleavage/methylation domain-containing protein
MRHSNQQGFSLIEILVALTVLAIGFMGVLTMTTTSTGSNVKAKAITSAAAVAADRMEMLMGLPYTDPLLLDTNGDGSAGLRDPFTLGAMEIPNPAANPTDYQITSADGLYTIYWNVAVNFPTVNTKTVRVIVTTTGLGPQKTVYLESVIPLID